MTECNHPWDELLGQYKGQVKCSSCDATLTPKQVLERARKAMAAQLYGPFELPASPRS